MPASTARAEYLKAAERFAVAENATMAARWGEEAFDSQQSSPLALEADAATEATRQLAQLAQVRARDVAVIAGQWQDLEGRTVRLPYQGRLGIVGEADLLVLRARVSADGTTELEGEVML
jgi:hypothetical protein